MCIVSFVKSPDRFTLTFNRDESKSRMSLPPKWRKIGSSKIFCPIDNVAGGTWIGYNRNIIACLQNGAFFKHERTPPYLKSRGILLKEVLSESLEIDSIKVNKFIGMEPFTMCIYDIKKEYLSIHIFDGNNTIKQVSDLKNPILIASSTLYSEIASNHLLSDFQMIQKDSESLFNFHKARTIGSEKNKFTDKVDTVSITQMVLDKGHFSCQYFEPNMLL